MHGVCICTRACTRAHPWASHACGFQVPSFFLPPYYLRHGLSLSLEPTGWLNNLASRPQQFASPTTPALGLQAQAATSSFQCGCWLSGLNSSCSHSEPSTNSAVFLATLLPRKDHSATRSLKGNWCLIGELREMVGQEGAVKVVGFSLDNSDAITCMSITEIVMSSLLGPILCSRVGWGSRSDHRSKSPRSVCWLPICFGFGKQHHLFSLPCKLQTCIWASWEHLSAKSRQCRNAWSWVFTKAAPFQPSLSLITLSSAFRSWCHPCP